MPRNVGTNLYYIPPGTEGFPDTTIESEKYNNYIHDVETDLNRPRPISAGGTGADDADEALANLHAEKAGQVVTNFDSHVWMAGSFYSTISATAPPVANHAFSGIAHITDANNMVVEAVDITDPLHKSYMRVKTAGVWGAWEGVSIVTCADDPPTGNRASDNALWFESSTGLLYIKYNDGDSSQWVIACPQPDISTYAIKTDVVAKSGDTMEGPLILPDDEPTLDLQAVNKKYVDALAVGSGSLVKTTDILTSGVWFPANNTVNVVIVRAWGAGGAGGGSKPSVGGQVACGGGGGSGGGSRKTITLQPPAAVTISNSSPAVVSYDAHGLAAGRPVKFSTTDTLPTGVTAGTTYYVVSVGLTSNIFQFSATPGGASVNTSSAGSGAHTITIGEVVTIGLGGTGVVSQNGNPGGTTSFGSWCSATGGNGGTANTAGTSCNPPGGSPGIGVNGDVNLIGAGGGFAAANAALPFITGGVGGAAPFGAGGGAMSLDGVAGGVGGWPGGGGGGAYTFNGSTPSAGGAGGGGAVSLEEYT